MITVKLKNERQILEAFRRAPDKMARGIQKAMQKIGLIGVSEAKLVITAGKDMWKPPIKTGAMRRGIQIREIMPFKVVIRPSESTPYAKFVHEGTSKMTARPFFKITEKYSKDKIKAEMVKEINKVVKNIFK